MTFMQTVKRKFSALVRGANAPQSRPDTGRKLPTQRVRESVPSPDVDTACYASVVRHRPITACLESGKDSGHNGDRKRHEWERFAEALDVQLAPGTPGSVPDRRPRSGVHVPAVGRICLSSCFLRGHGCQCSLKVPLCAVLHPRCIPSCCQHRLRGLGHCVLTALPRTCAGRGSHGRARLALTPSARRSQSQRGRRLALRARAGDAGHADRYRGDLSTVMAAG